VALRQVARDGQCARLTRLTQEHDAYRWKVNYHTLSDFRVEHGETLDHLLTDSVASLMAVGAVSLKWVTQDGMRVRASAGAAPSLSRNSPMTPSN